MKRNRASAHRTSHAIDFEVCWNVNCASCSSRVNMRKSKLPLSRRPNHKPENSSQTTDLSSSPSWLLSLLFVTCKLPQYIARRPWYSTTLDFLRFARVRISEIKMNHISYIFRAFWLHLADISAACLSAC